MTRVLVLEDDAHLLEVIQETLEEAGYTSQGAATVDQALAHFQRLAFDLVIADVRVAGNRDGLVALELMKHHRPELRCIVITGYASEDAPVRAVRLAVDDYLYKPFGMEDILQVVRRVFNAGQDRLSYKGVLSSVLSAPRKLLERAEQSRRESAGRRLDEERERCVQGFYVGVRSNLLSRGAALDAWDRLETLDAHYDWRHEATPAMLGELADSYRQLFDLLSAMARSQSVGSHAPRGNGQVERADFGRFFEKIRVGVVTQEQLQIASQLRRVPADARAANAELQRLFMEIWA